MFDISKKDKGKIRLFFGTDSPTVTTGFGHVSYELITRLLKTGRYEIISMGTNDRGEPHPLRGVKDLIIEPLPYISEDPYGRQRMPELLKKYQPDVIFGLNDIWVWTADERRPDMLNWFYKNIKSYKPYVPFVGYFCVDGRPWIPLWTDLINNMDAAVVYSDYGVKVLSETPGVNMSNVHKIYHGSSNEKFFPVEKKIKEEIRKEMGVEKDTFLIGIVCFKKGTQVLMSDFSTKFIEDIKSGDKVINHLGETDTVVEPMSRKYNGKIHKVKLNGSYDTFECTSNHKFFSIKAREVKKVKALSRLKNKKLPRKDDFSNAELNPDWHRIDSLNVGDYITTAIPKKIEDVKFIDCRKYNNSVQNRANKRALPDDLPLDKDMCKLIGLFLAEGSFGYVDGRPVSIRFDLSTLEEYIAKDIQRIVKDKFGFNCNIRARYRNNPYVGELAVEISSTALAELFKDLVPCHNARDKQMAPWLLRIGLKKQLEILDGWRLGDGCLSIDKGNSEHGHDRMVVITASEKLAGQMAIICLRNRINYTVSESWTTLNGKRFLRYRFNIPLNPLRPMNFYKGDFYYRRIQKNDTFDYNGDVYNFEVENAHSYAIGVSAYGASNCRNQPRKAVPRAIQAFKMFKDGYVKCDTCGFPRSLEVIKDCELCGSFGYSEKIEGRSDVALYLHMNLMDMRGFKLPKIINDNKVTNVISRPRHNVAEGVSIEELNKIYNAMDVSMLPTTAGSFELTVLESQAAGTPVIATRTTAVTELMDDGLGYMVSPETYMIMEDANHCYKHSIGMQGLIDSMEMSWRDWKDNSDRRKNIIKSGLVAAKEKTWDLAAEEFDKVFQEAAANREPLHELMKKPDAIHGINLVFVSESNSISKTVSMLPALQELAKKQELNVLFGLKRRFMPLVNNKDIHTFDIDYMWLEDSELPKYKYAINAIESIPDKYENGTWPYPAKNWHRLYCEALKVDANNDFGYIVGEAEDKKAKELVGINDKIKVLFIVDDADMNTGLDQKTWKMASEFLTRFDDVTKIGTGFQHILDDMELDVDLVDVRLRDIFAIIKNVDLVVVSDSDYIYVANLFPDTKFLFVNSARDDSINLIYPNVEFLPSKSRMAGMPIGQMEERGRRIIRSGEKRASDVHGAEIFSKILKFRKNFLVSKSELIVTL